MKIFTLPSKILKSLTGKKTWRVIPLYKGYTKSPIQKNKSVIMEKFFTSIKKRFAITHNSGIPYEILNVPLQPVLVSSDESRNNFSAPPKANKNQNDVAEWKKR